jgi:hypothetical protein
MSKKVTYKQALKEAIQEWDTTKTVDVKGPMLDPILSYKGDGELPIYRDAASILERYYFNEQEDKPLDYENSDGQDVGGDAMEHGEGTGTVQAGTSDANSIGGMKDEQEEEIAKEMRSLFEQDVEVKVEKDVDDDDDDDDDEDEDDETPPAEKMEESVALWFSEQEGEPESEEDKEKLDVDKALKAKEDDKEADEEAEDEGEQEKMTESMENAIIEKLIDEMETMNYTGAGVKPGMEAPDEKEMKDPEQHAHGAGTEQAGTGDAEGQIPDRKDLHDDMVEPKEYTDEWLNLLEQELEDHDEDEETPEDEAAESDEMQEKEKEKGTEKHKVGEGFPGGPISAKKYRAGDKASDMSYTEEMTSLRNAFKLFEEELQGDEDDPDLQDGSEDGKKPETDTDK